jgi:hypothetical protein
VEPVRASVLPSRHSPAFRILAVAGVGDSVYGLFNDDQADIFHHWEPLGNIGLTPNDFITAIASFDGRAVFIGSDAGRMFWLHPADGAQADVSPGGVGRVTRILVNASAGPALRGFSRADNTVLQLIGASADGPAGNWAVLGPVNAAGDTVFDIAVDWSAEPPRVFAATDARVFTTLDGRHWDSVSQGLPEDPHCAGLQVAGDYVFLSTFGRSMWRLPLDPCQPIVDAINDLESQISAREDDLSSIGGEVPPAERARIEAALRAEIRRLGQQLASEERLLQDCRRTHGTRN